MLAEHNVLIVADEALWAQVEDSLLTVLQPNPIGMMKEATFELRHRATGASAAADLRRYRHVVVIGRASDPFVAELLGPQGNQAQLPALLQKADAWTAGQRATVLALPEGGGAQLVLGHVDELAALIDKEYRVWSRERMYGAGLSAEPSDSLAAEGIHLPIPAGYRGGQLTDSVYAYVTGDSESRLLQSVLLTWRTRGGDQPAPEAILDWRQEMAARHYDWEQETQREPLQVRPIEGSAGGGVEVRGVWRGTIDGFPQAGPFITRVIDCPDQNRLYLVDAWLFAPLRGKYRYLVQLEALLDSFDCVAPADP